MREIRKEPQITAGFPTDVGYGKPGCNEVLIKADIQKCTEKDKVKNLCNETMLSVRIDRSTGKGQESGAIVQKLLILGHIAIKKFLSVSIGGRSINTRND